MTFEVKDGNLRRKTKSSHPPHMSTFPFTVLPMTKNRAGLHQAQGVILPQDMRQDMRPMPAFFIAPPVPGVIRLVVHGVVRDSGTELVGLAFMAAYKMRW